MPTDFIGLFAMLAAARIRFVLVGGLALVLHGLDRLTADVHLVIAPGARLKMQRPCAAGHSRAVPPSSVSPGSRQRWNSHTKAAL
jgi:hypothetical protein